MIQVCWSILQKRVRCLYECMNSLSELRKSNNRANVLQTISLLLDSSELSGTTRSVKERNGMEWKEMKEPRPMQGTEVVFERSILN